MSKYLLSMCIMIIIFVNGCSISENFKNNIVKKQSNFNFLSFDDALEKMIVEMLKPNNIILSHNTLFLIDLLENQTNIAFNQKELTELIKQKILKKTHKINFVKQEIIEKDKTKLGISNSIHSTNISTAILLSRNHKAKYYLYTCIAGKNEPFLLKIKLISVETGEVIFITEERFYW